MPLYEYRCKKCGHTFEKIQRFSDPPVKKCPKCGGAVEQLLSAPAVQFKGSGWYVTDYARSGNSGSSSKSSSSDSGSGSSDKESASKSGDKSEGKTEKKTEAQDKKATKK